METETSAPCGTSTACLLGPWARGDGEAGAQQAAGRNQIKPQTKLRGRGEWKRNLEVLEEPS